MLARGRCDLQETLDSPGLHFPPITKCRGLDKPISEIPSGSTFYDWPFCSHKNSRGSTFSIISYKWLSFQHPSKLGGGGVKNIIELKIDIPSHSLYQITNLIINLVSLESSVL